MCVDICICIIVCVSTIVNICSDVIIMCTDLGATLLGGGPGGVNYVCTIE